MGAYSRILLPWDSQPQEAVELNPAIPLRAEFCFLGSNPPFDFASNRGWTIASAATQKTGPAGRAIDFGGTAGAVSRTGTSTALQTRCTFVIVATRTANNPFAFIARFSGSNASFSFGCNDAGGINSGIVKGGVVGLATISIPVNVPHIIVASHRQDTGEYYCIARPLDAAGVLSVSATDTNASTASNGTVQLNPNGGANTFAGEVALAYGSFDFLPEQVGRELLSNPWQLFSPRSIWVPVSTASGGAYTLTADAAAFTLAAQDATLLKSKVVTADAGAFALAGQDATLTYAAGGTAYMLTCDAAAFSLAGQDATFLRNRVVSAEAASYSIGGQDATIAWSGEPAPVARRHAGGFARREQFRKGYIIKGRRYFLSDDELAVHIAHMLQEVSRGDVKEITAGKPKVINRRTWDAIKPLERLSALLHATDLIAEDDDEETLLMFM